MNTKKRKMRPLKLLLLFSIFLFTGSITFAQPRVVIMTDFPPVDVIPGGADYGPAEKKVIPMMFNR